MHSLLLFLLLYFLKVFNKVGIFLLLMKNEHAVCISHFLVYHFS